MACCCDLLIAPVVGCLGYAPKQCPPQQEPLLSEAQELDDTVEPPLLTLYKLSDCGTADDRELTEYPLADVGRTEPV